MLLLKFDTPPKTKTTAFQPNDTRIPQIFKMQYLHLSNGPIAFKFNTEVKYLKLHKKIVSD